MCASTVEPGLFGNFIPPVPVPPVVLASSASSSKSSNGSLGNYSRQSLKSLERLLGDDRDPRKLQKLVHKMYDNLKFEKERADCADRRASEVISYLKSICEEKLRAMREISRLEEELKSTYVQLIHINLAQRSYRLYKIQYEEAQKEIFRAQNVIEGVDERRFQAEKEAADARSTIRKMKEGINIMKAQDEGRQQGLEEGLKKGREIGYQEGLKLAQSKLENIVRAGPPASENAGIPFDSRTTNQIPHPQVSGRPSEVPSNVPSRFPLETLPPPSLSQGLVPPVSRSVHPMPKEPEFIRPPNASPSPHVLLSAIPPDNFIPRLEEDNKIHLPPPHEFSRPPPSPEHIAAPVENEDPMMIPPMVSVSFHPSPGRLTSPTSASTTLSHMDMVTDPNYGTGKSPMSAIPEFLSQEGSPEARNVASLARQPLLGTQSARIMTSSPNEPIYHRPRTASGASSISFQPPVIPDTSPRANVSITNLSTPNITVLPPLTPGLGSARLPSDPQSGPSHINFNTETPGSFLSPILEADSQPNFALPPDQNDAVNLPTMPSGQMQGYNFENPPVIPHSDLYTNVDDEEEAISSGFGSEGSLTTPPMRHEKLPNRTGSVRSAGGSILSRQARSTGVGAQSKPSGSQAGPSRAGSAVGAADGPSTGGSEEISLEEAHRSTVSSPSKYPQMPPNFQSNYASVPSKVSSKKERGSILSMTTNRSGQ